jgi:hypothetical protein
MQHTIPSINTHRQASPTRRVTSPWGNLRQGCDIQRRSCCCISADGLLYSWRRCLHSCQACCCLRVCSCCCSNCLPAAASLQLLLAQRSCNAIQPLPANAPAEASVAVDAPLGTLLAKAAAYDCDVVRRVHAQRLSDKLLGTALWVVVLPQPAAVVTQQW